MKKSGMCLGLSLSFYLDFSFNQNLLHPCFDVVIVVVFNLEVRCGLG